jgi:protein-disulfide isomerase
MLLLRLGRQRMLAHPMIRRIALAFVAIAACTSQAAGPPPGRGAGNEAPPSFDETPVPASPSATAAAVAAPTTAGASSCDAARLTLAPESVVARVDGKEIFARELGPDLDRAETTALRAYCDAIAQVRKQGLDNAVQQRLLAAASGTEDGTAWLRSEVDKLVEPPTDEDIASFYEQNKSENAPPLDQVKEQVIAAITQERMQNAAQGVLGKLRAAAKIETLLPEVRSPPMELADAETTAGFGPKDAKVHVVEFSDFECPYCARSAAAVTELKQKYAGQPVRFSYRHFPLSFHASARPAAEMAQCAAAQGKFWEFHDAVFASSGLADGALDRAAETAGLDAAALQACMASGKAAAQVDADMRKAEEVGVEGTPSFFVNGRHFTGGPGEIAAAIDAELAR